MRKKKPKRQIGTVTRGEIIFTYEQLVLLQDSFAVFEETLTRNAFCNPKIPFAREMFAQVKEKVAEMLLLTKEGRVFSFDQNELIILQTCLQLYAIDLLAKAETPENRQCFVACYRLQNLLPPLRLPPIKLHD